VLLAFGRTFGDYRLSDSVSGGIYARGSGMITLRGTPFLFGYFGPEWTVDKANVKLLTGVFMTGDGGMSAIAALWYNQGLPMDMNFFVGVDAYFPIDGANFGHEFRQYYSYVEFSWTADADSGLGLGVVQENFFSEDDVFEAAIGPALNFSKGSLWLAYDFTPAVEDDHVFLLRLTLHL
jgi:hypothetical protein